MPIYEYRCACGNEQEEYRSLEQRNKSPVCAVCGRGMERKWSIPCPPVMKQTGKGMALESLNSGHGFPKGPEGRGAAAAAARGLESPEKRYY